MATLIALVIVASACLPAPPSQFAVPAADPGPGPSTYRWLMPIDDAPVRYDPCTVQRYVINPANAPSGAIADVHAAFGEVGRLTGITFQYGGTTTEPAALSRAVRQDRYGTGWAPILVAFAPRGALGPPSVDPFAGRSIGIAGSTAVTVGGSRHVFVTGSVVLRSDQHLATGTGHGATWGKLALHEVGHVVGLSHVTPPEHTMAPTMHPRAGTFTGVEVWGLRRLGRAAGCLAQPESRTLSQQALVPRPVVSVPTAAESEVHDEVDHHAHEPSTEIVHTYITG